MDEALCKSGNYPNIALTPGAHRHAATGEAVKIPASARIGGGTWRYMECRISVYNGERNIDFEGFATPEVLDAILDMMREVVGR